MSGRREDLPAADLSKPIKLKVPVSAEQRCAALSDELTDIKRLLTGVERPRSRSE